MLNRYEVTIDGKAHSISLASRVIEGSEVRAKVDGKELVVVFSRPSKAEPGVILRVENQTFHIDVGGMRDPTLPTIRVDGRAVVVKLRQLPIEPSQKEQLPSSAKPIAASHGAIVAPIPGKVMSLRVREGDSVRVGQLLIMLEAMKMENEITASVTGTIRKVWVTEGTTVKKDQRLLEIS